MEKAYAILMFSFAVALFLYALAVLAGGTGLIMRYNYAKVDDPKKYVKQFSKVLMLVSAAPALSALFSLVFPEKTFIAFILLLVGVVAAITIGVRKIM